jgi:hypothetical protein
LGEGRGELSLAAGSVTTPGGAGFVATTRLLGSLVADAGSNYLVNVDLAADAASKLSVSGAATVAGHVDLLLLNTALAKPGEHVATILSAAGGVTNRGWVMAPLSTAVSSFSVQFEPNGVQLVDDINYAPRTDGALSPNELSFGSYLGRIQSAGGSARLTQFMTNVFAAPNVHALQRLYDGALPASSPLTLSSAALLDNLDFSDSLARCHAGSDDGDCTWSTIGGSSRAQSTSLDSVGFSRSGFGASGGWQRPVADGMVLGVAAMVSRDALSSPGEALSFQGNGGAAGIFLKHIGAEGTDISADLLAGGASYAPNQQLGGNSTTGSEYVTYVGAHFRAEQNFFEGGIKPFVDLGTTWVYGSGFDENANGFDTNLAAHSEVYPTVQGGVSLEGNRALAGALLNASLDLSVTRLLGSAQATSSASLGGAPSGAAPFALSDSIERTYFKVAPALRLLGSDKLSMSFGGSYTVGAGSRAYGGYLQAATRF